MDWWAGSVFCFSDGLGEIQADAYHHLNLLYGGSAVGRCLAFFEDLIEVSRDLMLGNKMADSARLVVEAAESTVRKLQSQQCGLRNDTWLLGLGVNK